MSDAVTVLAADKIHVTWRGRKLLYFGGCDYFRLSFHPAVRQALKAGLKKYGFNVAASRATTGDHPLYTELEGALAGFFETGDAVLVPNGYSANWVVAQALAGEFSAAWIDERSHPSLLDSGRALRCPVVSFKHRDPEDLERRMAKRGSRARNLVLTDGMFAQTGSVAPLRRYRRVLGDQGWILIDDAHGAGLLGMHGGGAAEVEKISRRRVVQTLTLSKAFGVFGGVILCSRELAKKIRLNSRSYRGSTPLPLPLAAAALKSVALLAANPQWRIRLVENAALVANGLRRVSSGWRLGSAPVLTCHPENAGESGRIQRELLREGIYPSLIRYPGGPPGGYFRLVISNHHRKRDLERLVQALTRSGRSGAGAAERGGSPACYLAEFEGDFTTETQGKTANE